jgi:type II secretory pathway pseudopilin PulG
MTRDSGFTLVESLVSLVLMVTVSGAVFALVTPTSTSSQTHPEALDMQQRARVAGDLLSRDLRMAGAGSGAGPRTGPLNRYFAPVVPRRMGLLQPDASTTVRGDAITITYAPGTHLETTVRDPLASGATQLRVNQLPNCPVGRPVCGHAEGAALAVFDQAGAFDVFSVTTVLGDVASLRAHRASASQAYPAGAFVTPAETHTYWYDPAARQLRHYDGYLTDVPVVDNVVGLRFEYFGDPNPPVWPRPAAGTANCLYDAAGARLPMPALPGAGASSVPLPLALFSDGPWCGEGDNRYDADLLRVRTVRVMVRVQAAHAGLRGTGADYAVPGTSRSARRALPDYAVTFDVTPRNLSLGR